MKPFHLSKTLLFCLLMVLCTLTSAQNFSEVSIASGIDHLYRSVMKMGGGASWFDIDRDGDEDLIMSGGLDAEGLYRNDGNGQFVNITNQAGLGFLDSIETMGVITGDIDNDGFREIFFTTAPGQPNILLYNNGNQTFSDITATSGIGADTTFSTSATFLDFNADGYLDIYVGNYILDQHLITDTSGTVIGFDPICDRNYLSRNNGNLQFSEVAQQYGVADTGCALAVANSRRTFHEDEAIFIANDFGQFHVPNRWYQSDGIGNFTEESGANGMNVGMYGMGIAAGDYDHDFDLDYFVTDIGPNKLMNLNHQTGIFSDVAAAAGVQSGTLMGLNTTGWGTAFFDYDNDSWQDLYVSNGQITVVPFIANVARDPDKLYHNEGNGLFTDATMAEGIVDSGWGRGMATCDFDLDGDVDVLTMVIHFDSLSGEHSKLWKNNQNTGHHWVNIRLEGTTAHSNRDAIGATVMIDIPGLGGWLHHVSGGESHMSQNSSMIHIGLDTFIDYNIRIRWPGGGDQWFTGLPIDSTFTILEDSTQFIIAADQPLEAAFTAKIYPNPTSSTWRMDFAHAIDEELYIEILDLQGRQRWFQPLGMTSAGAHTLEFGPESLPSAGAYLVRLRGGTHQISKMIIRQ